MDLYFEVIPKIIEQYDLAGMVVYVTLSTISIFIQHCIVFVMEFDLI